MSEVIFSKKQIGPLVEKYSIDAQNNETFKSIITAFDGQVNYQIWAIKAVFENVCPIDNILRIKEWAETNQTEIKNLVKGNIVAYKTKTDFSQLEKEMRGLDMIGAVRSTINKFNTAQKDMMRKAILDNITNGIIAKQDANFKKWYNLFKSIERMSEHRKQKLISLASAINDMPFMEKYLGDALAEGYEWNKEDMLAFVANNCPDCKVTFNEGNYVILDVPSFKSSKALCGAGRTSWCLTRQESYFKSYVKETGVPTHQYFYFNFGLKENDELAHVGFTVQEGRGITNAHSTKNQALVGIGIQYKGRTVNINDVLNDSNIPLSLYMKLKELTTYKWDYNEFMTYIKNHPSQMSLCFDDKTRVIVRAMTNEGVRVLAGHTFVNLGGLSVTQDSKIYFLLDFSQKYDDTNALIAMGYVKDRYQFDKLNIMSNAYNVNLKDKNFLDSIGIKTDMFLDREKIDPRIMFHKFIEEKNEKDAIELLEKNGSDFDVNYEFNCRKPIFMAIDYRLYNIFEAILKHPKFDSAICDSFDETLLQSLLYNYHIEGVTSEEDDKITRKQIEVILNCDNMDFNEQDINYDTAINIACERLELLFAVEALVNNPKVNLNVINDFNCTALTNAIRYKNVEAIKLLATRKDLVVRPEDETCAATNGIDLKSLISSDIFASSKEAKIEKRDSIISDIYSELFAKAFAEIRE